MSKEGVLLREDRAGGRVSRPISYSACELDRGSNASGVSSSVRRSSYVTAAESSDMLFLIRTTGAPNPDSDFTSGYTTQESGDIPYSIEGGSRSGLRDSYHASLDFPVQGRWTSTGSLSLVNTMSADLDCGSDADQKSIDESEQEPDRGKWDSPAEFILSCLGYAVGLGNVWRFPYMVYSNGGGAFLIPYTLMLMLIGIPVFMIELAVGQYSAKGPVHVFNAAPLFQGIGVGMVITLWGGIYYQMIITWSLYYLFASWQKVLPWSNCKNSYNTPDCYSKTEAKGCEDANGLWHNQTCYNATYIESFNENMTVCNTTMDSITSTASSSIGLCENVTVNSFVEYFKANMSGRRVSAPEEYFNYGMLARSANLEETGHIKWDICLTYLLAWIICYLCIIRGIRSSGKVVYFTATFPYLLLVILFFRAVTLPGALKGIIFYLKPDFKILLTPKVWADAAGQIFFSLSVGSGGLMTYASYNTFHNNIYRDTLIVSIGNCLTSFFAGFVIFPILGFMATELGVEVKDVAKSGSGLAFIAYPEIVTRLFVPQLWASLFFFMLITLGLDSMFAGLENTQTAIVDTFPSLRNKKPLVSLGICVFCFLLGLTQCTNSGIYWTELCAYYNAGWAVLLMGMAEAIVFAWVYGARRLANDISVMVGFHLKPHWWITWTFLTPTILLVIFFVNVIKFTPLSYGDYVLPNWAQALGWMMAVNGVIMIPILMIYHIVRSYKKPEFAGMTFLQRVVKLCKPRPEWYANMEQNRNINSNNSIEAPQEPSAPKSIEDPPPSYNSTTSELKNRKSFDNPAFPEPDVSSYITHSTRV